MTAREYLGAVSHLTRHIEANAEQIERLRALAERITPVYGTQSGGGKEYPDSRAEMVARIVDLENGLNADTKKLRKMWSEANERIDRMPDATYCTLLRLRYLAGKTFACIAEEMHYTERHVYRLHEEALQAFGRKYSKELHRMKKCQ